MRKPFKAWGNTVGNQWENLPTYTTKLPQPGTTAQVPGYKATVLYTRRLCAFPTFFHRNFSVFTSVLVSFVPTIHNTYKYKSILNKLFSY